ncbi:MAG: DUF1122 family protein [Actinomycetota bacterium]|nr:DUF1122 family protein [Actinomycetota bacterium]
MPLEDLDGKETSHGLLRLGEARRGRFPEERDAVVYAGDATTPAIRLKHFGGRRSAGVNPWIEASVARDDEGFAAELVAALADLLPPGGYVMVGYGDDETERGLKRRFPPAVTPLGKALFDAGCTWFKDWYYPEGWMEGGMKLQGNKPISDEARTAHLGELRGEIEEWLGSVEGATEDLVTRARERAQAVLARAS